MDVKLIKENEDGSAEFMFDMNPSEIEALLQLGIITAIKNGIEEGKKYAPSQPNLDNTTSRGTDSVHGTREQSNEPGSTGDGFKTSQVLG
jgi:hypothetical protein